MTSAQSRRNNLAGAYREAGYLDQATELIEAVIADTVRVLGTDHPDALTARSNLAARGLGVGMVRTQNPDAVGENFFEQLYCVAYPVG